MEELKILFEDRDILVAVKPEGVDSEAAKGLVPDMVNLVRSHLSRGQGEPYVGLIQRLDRPVTGIMVFAKNKESAAALSKELKDGGMGKRYRAVLCGQPKDKQGTLSDFLVKDEKTNLTRVGKKGDRGAKNAELNYTVIQKKYTDGERISEVEIELLTGRHHQIRVQFASHGMPLMGDRKYNPAFAGAAKGGAAATELGRHLCLCNTELSFTHPKTRKRMTFRISAPFEALL